MVIKKMDVVSKTKKAAAYVYGAVMSALLPVAAAAQTVTVNDLSNQTVDQLAGSIIGQLFVLARIIGVILLAFGVYQLYLAFQDDNPNGKIKAITLCVASIGLMTLKGIMTSIGVIS